MNIKQRCEELGISIATYYFRLKNGMTPEQALSVPNKRKINSPVKNETNTLEPENENADLDCVFALFQQENGKLKPIFNGDLSETYLLKIAIKLLDEATRILKITSTLKEDE